MKVKMPEVSGELPLALLAMLATAGGIISCLAVGTEGVNEQAGLATPTPETKPAPTIRLEATATPAARAAEKVRELGLVWWEWCAQVGGVPVMSGDTAYGISRKTGAGVNDILRAAGGSLEAGECLDVQGGRTVSYSEALENWAK